MGKINLALFKPEQTTEVAKALGFDLRKTKCCICKQRVNSKNIGHFVHLDHVPSVVCDNSYCFKHWILMEKQDIFTINDNSKNTQPNTPITNPKGEGRSGKTNGDFSEISSVDNTAGVEARTGDALVSGGDE